MSSILFLADVTGVDKKLDSCSVSVYPALNPDHETLSLPENMLSQFGVVAKVNKDGVVVSGADLIYNYEQVGFDIIFFMLLLAVYNSILNSHLCLLQILRQIQYTNRKPAYYLNRVFKLICSELNGRFLSNEYVQTVSFCLMSMNPYIFYQSFDLKCAKALQKAKFSFAVMICYSSQ